MKGAVSVAPRKSFPINSMAVVTPAGMFRRSAYLRAGGAVEKFSSSVLAFSRRIGIHLY